MKTLQLIFLMSFLPIAINAQIFDCKNGGGGYFEVTALSGLNMRKEPKLESEKIHKLSFGAEIFACDFCDVRDSIDIDNIKGVWKKVYFGDFEGFVFSGYLKPQAKVEIMCPYDWQSEDIDHPIFKDSTDYFGIYREDNQYQSKVMLYERRDSIIESVPFVHKRISVSEEDSPELIVSGLKLEDGQSIEGVFCDSKILYPGESIFLKNSCIYATGTPIVSDSYRTPFSMIEDYKLILREFDHKGNYKEEIIFNQNLIEFGGGQYEGGVRIKWIGDMDGDNKLDILLSFSTHYGFYQVILMLSTKAQGKRLLGEVARYGVSSC